MDHYIFLTMTTMYRLLCPLPAPREFLGAVDGDDVLFFHQQSSEPPASQQLLDGFQQHLFEFVGFYLFEETIHCVRMRDAIHLREYFLKQFPERRTCQFPVCLPP